MPVRGPRQQRGLLPRPASLYGLDRSHSGRSWVLIAPTLKHHNSGSRLTRTMFPTATASEVRRPGKSEPNPLTGQVSWFLSMILIGEITGLQGSKHRPVPSLAAFLRRKHDPCRLPSPRPQPTCSRSRRAPHSGLSRRYPCSRGRGLHGLQSACATRPGAASRARRGRRPCVWSWMAAGRGRPCEGSLGIGVRRLPRRTRLWGGRRSRAGSAGRCGFA